jgi:thymidylate synthase (FAD)
MTLLEDPILDPLNDGKSKLELIDYMGSDLSVVNDARASFNKQSMSMSEKDVKLIHYLINHRHFSPLRGVVFKFRVKAPLYVCRQWFKHLIASSHNDDQLGWNEKSFRFTEIVDADEFYIPQSFRVQSKDNRQCSDGELLAHDNERAIVIYSKACLNSYRSYRELLDMGIGREQARGVLAPSIYTSWVWTVSLQALLNFIDLRLGDGAQSEISAYAQGIVELIKFAVPVTMEAWGGG